MYEIYKEIKDTFFNSERLKKYIPIRKHEHEVFKNTQTYE